MRNLSTQEKKLISRIILIAVSILFIIFSYRGVNAIITDLKIRQEKQKIELIQKYTARIDSVNIVNNILTAQVDSLEKQIIVAQGKKEIIYIEAIKKDKEIKDAFAAEHAKAIDTLTAQLPTWTIIKDSVTKDTVINYKFTLPGVIKARLTINDLYKYKKLYNVNEEIIIAQRKEIDLQKSIIKNDSLAIAAGGKALSIASKSNEKLLKQLNKAENRASRWPYLVGAGIIGGITICLLVK